MSFGYTGGTTVKTENPGRDNTPSSIKSLPSIPHTSLNGPSPYANMQ